MLRNDFWYVLGWMCIGAVIGMIATAEIMAP